MGDEMNILEIKDLHTYFTTKRGCIKAVNGVTLTIKEGETLGVIGESGSGKSQTAMSILKLFEKNQKIHSGEIIFDNKVISNLSAAQLRSIRGNSISMIFQEPMTSLNPVFTIERQITETLMLHQGLNKKQARIIAIEMLNSVKIPDAQGMIRRYPHELSGGMRQRVMIAIALACKPKLLIADEPTTALDVTIQAQILRLLDQLKQNSGTAIMFITHDLGVIRQVADTVAVLYCGQVVELAPVAYIFDKEARFSHPYTRALLNSMPSQSHAVGGRLEVIQGNVPHPHDLPAGCKFAPRCRYSSQQCIDNEPQLVPVSTHQSVRCFNPESSRCANG